MINRLMQLFKDNAKVGGRFEIKVQSADEATIYLYDAIGGWYGIPAQDFVQQLNGLTASTIHLRINSPGGDVFDARAMQTAIRQHPAQVIAHIDGLAASAATFLALGANEIEISQGGFFMIHNAWALVIGNKSDMLAMATVLEKIDLAIMGDYLGKTKMNPDEMRKMMDAETWLAAEEALSHGFVDRIYEGRAPENRWNLKAYNHAPETLNFQGQQEQYDRATIERRLALVELNGR